MSWFHLTFELTPNNNTTLPNGVTLTKVLKYPYDIQYILKVCEMEFNGIYLIHSK